MTIETVAILSPGDMGHAVGRSLAEHGLKIITCLAQRSERTRKLAAAAELEDVATLEALVEQADLILSIMPPSTALASASEVAAAMENVGNAPCYADCNAISPMTAKRIAAVMARCSAEFVDAGIIATGFLLRVLGGALAIAVPISGWLVVCTFLLSLYL